MTDYAINPKTGEVIHFDGKAWAPVEKSHIAKNAAGEVQVFDGEAWKPITTNSPVAPSKIQAQEMDEAGSHNPTPVERMKEQAIAQSNGRPAPFLPDNASIWTRGVDWLRGFNDAADTAANRFTGFLSDEAAGLGRATGGVLRTGDTSNFKSDFNKGMDAVNSNIRAFHERNPFLASSIDAISMLASPVFRVGNTWQEAAVTPGGRAVRGAISGAGTGAATAAAYNDGGFLDRLKAAGYGAATGGALGLSLPPLLEGTALGAQTFGEAVAKKKAEAAAKKAAARVPSVAEIKSAANSEYDKAGAAGLIIKPQAVQNLGQSIQGELAQFGYHPELQPKVAVILRELDRVGKDNATAEGIDTMRKIALGVARSNDPSERALGGMIVGKIDEMMENLSPADILQGNAQQATESLANGRQLWKTMRKAELLENLVDKGELQGMSTNSGGNIQNLIRQKLRSTILENPKNARMFTPEEIKDLRKIVAGTWGQNALRTLGRLAPSSNAWLSVISTAAVPGGVAFPLLGAGAKTLATRSTKKAIENLTDNVKRGANSLLQQPSMPQPPSFPLQVRQQLINQEIRKRLGLMGANAAGALGGLEGAQ